ncbi:MAG: phosphatidate cytidylyltransferase [Opitutales bacterium]|jgi:phosphatidate cytidylyltransferase
MKGRIASTLGLWAILAGTTIFFGAEGAVALTAIVAALTQYELYKMLARMGNRPLTATGIALGLLISLSPLLGDWLPFSGVEAVAPAIVLFSVAALLRRPRGNPVNALASTLLGLLLAPCTLLFISMTIYHFGPRREGLVLALWLVMATKFTDMGALLSGLAFGKHKMAPVLSPKKTWEGAAGGVLVSMVCSALLAFAFPEALPAKFSPAVAALVALPVAVASIFADLLESAFKRESGVKDSGRILPGIGGVFDLTDSFMLSAPLAYYLMVCIIG